MQNCLLVRSFLKGKLPKSIENFFQKSIDVHVKPTRFSSSECLYIPRFISVTCGMNSIIKVAILFRNKLTEVADKPSSLLINEVRTIISNNDWAASLTTNKNFHDFHLILSHK